MRLLSSALFPFLFLVLLSCNNQANKKADQKDSSETKIDINKEEMPQPGDTVFTGFGNEPFWAIYVINNKKIVFHPMEGADIEVPYVAPAVSDSITHKYASAANAAEIVLIVTKKPCSDGMSDLTHPYAVELMVNKTNYSGCGSNHNH